MHTSRESAIVNKSKRLRQEEVAYSGRYRRYRRKAATARLRQHPAQQAPTRAVRQRGRLPSGARAAAGARLPNAARPGLPGHARRGPGLARLRWLLVVHRRCPGSRQADSLHNCRGPRVSHWSADPGGNSRMDL